jgi:hypothetical protein
LLWSNIQPPDIVPLNADGTLDDAAPYFDLTDLAAGGTLEPGESTQARLFTLRSPSMHPFHFDSLVTAVVLQEPPAAMAPMTAFPGTTSANSAALSRASGGEDEAPYSVVPIAPQAGSVGQTTSPIADAQQAGLVDYHASGGMPSDGEATEPAGNANRLSENENASLEDLALSELSASEAKSSINENIPDGWADEDDPESELLDALAVNLVPEVTANALT